MLILLVSVILEATIRQLRYEVGFCAYGFVLPLFKMSVQYYTIR